MSDDDVQAIGEWATNGDLIADAARLGYLRDEWVTLDATYGVGTFWSRWRPRELHTLDLAPGPGVSVVGDFRSMPWPDQTFRAVVFDPPYKLNGTPTSTVDGRYGVAGRYTSRAARHRLMVDGLTDCARLLIPGGYLLVKCQDQVNGGRVRWQTRMMTEHAESLGLDLVDWFLFRSGRPQPSGRRQEHARRGYSSLLVFTHRPRVKDF